ncbi:hypothetical protein BJ742DRAFT_743230 [Cladochytrium replicatum]|nr:hypothetical protein BJ742DRAFT_743230 [Cladochytrium replicatum]
MAEDSIFFTRFSKSAEIRIGRRYYQQLRYNPEILPQSNLPFQCGNQEWPQGLGKYLSNIVDIKQMPKEKRRSKRSKKQQNKGNVYNEEPEDIDKSSSTSSPLEKERETQNNALNRKRRKLNTSRRSLSSSAQAVEGEGEADNQGYFTAAEPTSELGMAQDAARVGTDTRFSSLWSLVKPDLKLYS